MLIILGFIIVSACVAGGFVLAGGQLISLWQPFEILIIGGAAFGAFVSSNPASVLKGTVRGMIGALKGSKYIKPCILSYCR